MAEPAADDKRPLQVGILAVVPSPYQRDIFASMAARDDMQISVFYLENQSPDSPWPLEPLRAYERVLDGRWLAAGGIRWHQCRMVPNPERFDFFIVNSFMSSTAQALMRKALAGRPWAFWGERLRTQRSVLRRYVQSVLTAPIRRASLIAGIGSLAVDSYRAMFPGVRLADIPYHCALAPFQNNPARPGHRGDGALRILFCGQMIARKGLDILLDAFVQMAPTVSEAELVLVGREAELSGLLAEIPPTVRSRIDYRGFRAPAELPEEFARADLFVLPSRHDGWGVVVNQALGAGLPIVCSDAVGSAHDLVHPKINGHMVAAGDADQLAATMRGLLESPAMLAAMGSESLALASAWTPEAGAMRWVTAISETLGCRRING